MGTTVPPLSRQLALLEERLIALLLGTQAREKYAQGDLPHALLRPYADHIASLSTRYVAEGRQAAPAALTKEEAIAYALYFGIITFAKVYTVLATLPAALLTDTHSLLDIGAGPGTGTLAMASLLPTLTSATLVEPASGMSAVARTLIGTLLPHLNPRVEETIAPARRLSVSGYNLILCANVLNEIKPADQSHFLQNQLALLAPEGLLLIIEPALPAHTRSLMTQRDVLLKQQNIQVIYPCTHQLSCPLLRASENDWCHTTLHWERPRLVDQLDQLTGFNKHRIKYSALVLQHTEAPEKEHFPATKLPQISRAVTDSEKTRHGNEVLVCGDGALHTLRTKETRGIEITPDIKRIRQWDTVTVNLDRK